MESGVGVEATGAEPKRPSVLLWGRSGEYGLLLADPFAYPRGPFPASLEQLASLDLPGGPGHYGEFIAEYELFLFKVSRPEELLSALEGAGIFLLERPEGEVEDLLWDEDGSILTRPEDWFEICGEDSERFSDDWNGGWGLAVAYGRPWDLPLYVVFLSAPEWDEGLRLLPAGSTEADAREVAGDMFGGLSGSIEADRI